MTITVFNTNSSGAGTANVAQSLGFTATGGRTLIVFVWGEDSNTVTGVTDSAANSYPLDASSPKFGNGRYFYRCQSLTGSPTTITVQAPTNIGIYWAAIEATGIATIGSLSQSADIEALTATAHTISFTTTTNNELAFYGMGYGANAGTSSSTAPDTLIPQTKNTRDAVYNADKGTAGAKTLVWNSTNTVIAYGFLATYKAATGATVSTITGTTATEGSAVVFTVTMSGTGGLTDAYSWSGTAGSGDYTQKLKDEMFNTKGGSGSVTVSGSNIVVPSAVTEFTVTVPTTGDALDEANETIRLVFGGVTASSGTITDDDAAPTLTGTASSTVTAGDPVVITYSPGLSGQSRTYTLALTDGTATGGTDYDNTTVTGDFAVTAGTGNVSISDSTVTVDPGVTEFTLTITTTA